MAIDAHSTPAPTVQPGLLPPPPELPPGPLLPAVDLAPAIDDVIVLPRYMTAADFGMGLEIHEPEPGEPQTALSMGMGPAWLDLADAVDLASLAEGRRRHAYRMAADAVDHLIALMDTLDAAGEDLEPEAGYDLPEGDDERCASSEVDDEHPLGWTACMSQVNLGRNTDDLEETALERHGRGFIRSGPDDSEDDDPAGGQQLDEDIPFWSIDIGCAIGAPLDVEGAHV